MTNAPSYQALLDKLRISQVKIADELLIQALTHKSVQVDKQSQFLPHNERLEYLGDAILKSSISEWLYHYFPQASEGQMSQIRSYVVSDAALSRAARDIELDAYVILGESEKASSSEIRESILANVLEALCGAVYISSDFQTTARMILSLLRHELALAVQGEAKEVMNYKAQLQEYAQGKFKCLPEYTLVRHDGPDHERTFYVEVSLNNEILGQGEGRSKKKAEQESARQALEMLTALDPEANKQEKLEIPPQAHAYFNSFEEKPMTSTASLLLAPSILSADFSNLGAALQAIEAGGADWVHLDVMDGHFVPNLTLGPPIIQALRPLTRLPFDAHLMISNPEKYIETYAKAGCDRITVHAEACPHLDRVLSQIHEVGAVPGVVLNPATPVSVLEHVLDKVKQVLLMSVNPGFGGQSFIPEVLTKIRQLRALLQAKGLQEVRIQVDGGINQETLPLVIAAGADVVVIGSAIFNQTDVVAATRQYKTQLVGLAA